MDDQIKRLQSALKSTTSDLLDAANFIALDSPQSAEGIRYCYLRAAENIQLLRETDYKEDNEGTTVEEMQIRFLKILVNGRGN